MTMRVLVALISATVLATSCAALGGAAPSATPSIRDQAVTAWHDVVQCARDHGFNAPDPQVDDQGNATFPADVGKPPDDVMRACEQFISRLPAAQTRSGEGPTPEDIRLGRQFAACLRQNGLSYWPDPNSDGTFPATPEVAAEGKSERFMAAGQACAQFHPSGRLFIGAAN
jgi:hypothetical protein